jgi:hypothetical protein
LQCRLSFTVIPRTKVEINEFIKEGRKGIEEGIMKE